MTRLFSFAAALALSLIATPVLAQPALVSSTPAQDGTASRVTQIALTFAEPLSAPLSGMAVLMTAMPGMDHHQPMTMSGVVTTLDADGRTLIATLARPLPKGTYEADWHAATPDHQRASGRLIFTVR